MATFLVNGIEKRITFRTDDVGIDFASDFIGSYEHGMEQDDDGRFIASPEDFDWWGKVIEDAKAIEALVSSYAERYGDDAVEQCLQEQGAYSTDLDMMLAAVMRALQTLDDDSQAVAPADDAYATPWDSEINPFAPGPLTAVIAVDTDADATLWDVGVNPFGAVDWLDTHAH